jgi:hypothetical protein
MQNATEVRQAMPQRVAARNAPTQGASRKSAWNSLVARRGESNFRTMLALFAFVLISSGTASAQTVQQVLRDFGLLGTWQTDCSKPAASNNFRTIYEGLSNGDVRRTYYDAPGKIYSQYVLKRVSRVSANQILYEQEGQNDLQFVVLTKIGNRYRVFFQSQSGRQGLCAGGQVREGQPRHARHGHTMANQVP